MLVKDTYILKKEVDWSALHYGINIPISIQIIFYEAMKNYLRKGENKSIDLILNGKIFKAIITNINFDKSKYPNHKELLQIRWTENSPIAVEIRRVFQSSFKFLKVKKDKLLNSRKHIKIPEELKEYIILYTTQDENVLLVDYLSQKENKEINSLISTITEEEFEYSINYEKFDLNSKIEQKQKLVKIRKLDKSICENLKHLYRYKCQICKVDFGKSFDTKIIEAHHIESFTKSMNNNYNNILIICPNHHRVIHKTNPDFDKNNLFFLYPNGLKEKLLLNSHL